MKPKTVVSISKLSTCLSGFGQFVITKTMFYAFAHKIPLQYETEDPRGFVALGELTYKYIFNS